MSTPVTAVTPPERHRSATTARMSTTADSTILRDEALFLAWRAGDERSGAVLLRQLRPRLLRYIRRLRHRTPDLAEDLAHDALISLVAARNTLRDGRALRAYLFTAARRIEARERSRRRAAEVELDEHRAPAALTCSIELDRIDVVRLLASRSSRCTETVAAYYLEGRRAPEIARQQRVSENTVRSQIRHGLAQLRRSVRH